jgi:DNA-binding LytR/AlgR family response regulator
MKIVIAEDELPAYKRLVVLLRELIPGLEEPVYLDSIRAAIAWFTVNPVPDLVFLDIHLADGSGFDLLKKVQPPCPVIFVTAYDEYALKAFQTNSLSYLLKPVRKDDLQQALQKLAQIRHFYSGNAASEATVPVYKTRFAIRFGEHLKTLQADEIAYCYTEHKMTFARTSGGQNFPMDHNLDTLEGMLDPQKFFRINRQFIISLDAIDEMKVYSKGRVMVRLRPEVKEIPVVSSERAAAFKLWLGGEV